MNVPASTTNLRYRTFTLADIPAAHALSSEFGWKHRPQDWRFSAETSLGFVAEEEGSVIGTAMCWKYGADRASLGHIIVSSWHQGRGIGRRLMELILQELDPRVTFLHATPAGKPLYEKLGFSECGLLEQYQGNAGKAAPAALLEGERLRAGVPADFPYLIELSTRACGLERHALLSLLLQNGESVVLERNGEIIGFSVLRTFGLGYVIGPVVAQQSPGQVHAKALIGHWLAAHEGEFMRVDVPAGTGLADWLINQGLKQVDVCPKMVRNARAQEHRDAPDPEFRLYGLVSQAML